MASSPERPASDNTAICQPNSRNTAPESTAASGPHIYRIPNELLLGVFNHVTHESRIDDFYYDDWGRDLMSLRATCRLFRAIRSHLKIWRSDSFSLAHLLLNPRDLRMRSAFNQRALNLLRCLIEDRVLYETFSSRVTWSIVSIQMLYDLFDEIPRVRDNLKRFCFQDFTETRPDLISGDDSAKTIKDAIALLQLCPNLEFIQVFRSGTVVPLDWISECCPSLKTLHLFILCYSGSLSEHCNLRHLRIENCQLFRQERLLPLASAETLKSLQANYTLYNSGDEPNFTQPLTTFSNLTWLHLSPLTNSAVDMLIQSELPNLRAFLAVLCHNEEIGANRISQLFSSSSFNRLQILSFLVDPDRQMFRFDPDYLIKPITSNLSSTLEYLNLTLEIDTAWFAHIKQLFQLKVIYWNVPPDDYLIFDNPELVPGGESHEGLDGNVCLQSSAVGVVEELTEAASSYFGSGHKPTLEIFVLTYETFDRWWQSAFVLEESGFEMDPFDVSKTFTISQQYLAN